MFTLSFKDKRDYHLLQDLKAFKTLVFRLVGEQVIHEQESRAIRFNKFTTVGTVVFLITVRFCKNKLKINYFHLNWYNFINL